MKLSELAAKSKFDEYELRQILLDPQYGDWISYEKQDGEIIIPDNEIDMFMSVVEAELVADNGTEQEKVKIKAPPYVQKFENANIYIMEMVDLLCEQASTAVKKKGAPGCITFFVFFFIASCVGSAFDNDIISAILFLVAILAGIVVGFVRKNNNEDKIAVAKNKAKIQYLDTINNNLSILHQIYSSASKIGFISTKWVCNIEFSDSLAIDSTNKKWLIKTAMENDYHIFDFKQLVSYELCVDGQSTISGNEELALTGGLLFGTVGAIAGASAPKQIKEDVNSVYINIVDDNANRHKIVLLDELVSKDTCIYSGVIEETKEMLSVLDTIKHFCPTDSTSNVKPSFVSQDDKQNADRTDKFEQMKQFKELLDIGAITEAEYNRKKSQLLDL